ncbi:MAG: S26 family signal peptidase [Planctomycetota bacterium]|nr:S26 family signal peptidase [Planctomycetota bacterium]
MTSPSSTSSASPPAAAARHKGSIRETFISIIIAFAMAFVFRGFVVEAFLIPTGSMAPTLLGQHMRFQSRSTGYAWPVDTRDRNAYSGNPLPIQGSSRPVVGIRPYPETPRTPGSITVHDPMSRDRIEQSNIPVAWGDRIFVLKYLYSIYDPQRFDVVVFKNPTDPTQNFIKRLVGLPNEMVALIDGDVFTRPASAADAGAPNPWLLPGWTVQRKPERAQLAMWQTVADTSYAPINSETLGRKPVWRAATPEHASRWRIGHAPTFAYTGEGPSALEWNPEFPINDSYAYNEASQPEANRVPVGDVRLSAGIEAAADGLVASPVVRHRGHEFRADISADAVVLRMKRLARTDRAADSPGMITTPEGEWVELARAQRGVVFRPGQVVNIEFWHVDQSVALYVNDERVAFGAYTMTPDERLRFSVGLSAEQASANDTSLVFAGYQQPVVRWEFGGPVTMHRVALARDIHYQATTYRSGPLSGRPALATHPASTLTLGPDQFFVCGDNSPASSDGRLWDPPNPWVAEYDEDTGIVPRDLLIGKAFWVYFPAPYKRQGIPVPDFGRMRFIW